MPDRKRVAGVVVAVVLCGCVTHSARKPYTAPVVTTPVVVDRESASRLEVLVKADVDTDKRGALSHITPAMNAIASELRQANFRVTMDPKASSSVTIKVGIAMSRDAALLLKVLAEANGVVIDQFSGSSELNLSSSSWWEPDEVAAFGRYVRERLERSEALAILADELGAKPHAGKSNQARSWAKPTAASVATRRIAVLEFRGSLPPNLLAVLSDQARAAAVEAVRPQGIAVMTRENTAVMLKDQGKTATCSEGECEVETARLIGAHLVVTGEVSRIGNARFLAMKLFDAESGTLLASKQADATDDLALVRAAKPAAAALFE